MRDGALHCAVALALALPAATAITACGGEEMFGPQLASTEQLIERSATARFVRDDETVAELVAVGDLDGDGIDDAVMRTMYAQEPAPPGEGFDGTTTYVVYGGSQFRGEIDLSTLPRLSNSFQETIAPVGDVDGDGYADLLIGVSHLGANCGLGVPRDQDFSGAYLVYGGPQRLTGTTSLIDIGVFIRDTSPCTYVAVVVALGDLDGDGLSDFALGRTPLNKDAATQVYVFYGSHQRLAPGAAFDTASAAVLTVEGNEPGVTPLVVPAGDVDHDGHDDLIVRMTENAQSSRVSMIRGSATRLQGVVSPDAIAQTSYEFRHVCGPFAARLGDLDGDGFDDFALGDCTELFHPPDFQRDLTWRVFYGAASGFPPNVDPGSEAARIHISGTGSTDIAAGDVDSDGVRDLLIGDDGLHDGNGAVHVLSGSRTRLTGDIDPAGRGTSYVGRTRHVERCDNGRCTINEEVGTSIILGDFTGDHRTDFMACAPGSIAVASKGLHGSAPGRVYLVSPPAAP